MKKLKFFVLAALVVQFSACNNTESRYVDLNTGKTVYVVTDSSTGYSVDSVTRIPVDIYYDKVTKDTIYGKTHTVINNQVVRQPDGRYTYIEPAVMTTAPDSTSTPKAKPMTQEQRDLQLLNKYGKYKKKVGDDGDVKIVEGEKKIKVDGETGKKTVKEK